MVEMVSSECLPNHRPCAYAFTYRSIIFHSSYLNTPRARHVHINHGYVYPFSDISILGFLSHDPERNFDLTGICIFNDLLLTFIMSLYTACRLWIPHAKYLTSYIETFCGYCGGGHHVHIINPVSDISRAPVHHGAWDFRNVWLNVVYLRNHV